MVVRTTFCGLRGLLSPTLVKQGSCLVLPVATAVRVAVVVEWLAYRRRRPASSEVQGEVDDGIFSSLVPPLVESVHGFKRQRKVMLTDLLAATICDDLPRATKNNHRRKLASSRSTSWYY